MAVTSGVRMMKVVTWAPRMWRWAGRLELRGAHGGTFEDALQRLVGRLKQDIA